MASASGNVLLPAAEEVAGGRPSAPRSVAPYEDDNRGNLWNSSYSAAGWPDRLQASNNNNHEHSKKNRESFRGESQTVKMEELDEAEDGCRLVDADRLNCNMKGMFDLNENIVDSLSVRYSKKRNPVYQDVNEALSSLLWQPYEYQNKNDDYLSSSSFGSYCSLSSSFDLENGEPNNERADNKADNIAADLHLDVVVTMVNNPEGNAKWLNQYEESFGSRELLAGSPSSRLLSKVSGNESVGCGGCRAVAFASSSSCGEFDGGGVASSEMSSSQPGNVSASADSAKSSVSVVNLNQSGGNVESAALQQKRPPYILRSGNCQSFGGVSDLANLNSINVVGLPHNHSRHSSVPSSSSTTRNALSSVSGKGFPPFPNHPRNSSEPVGTVYAPPPNVAVHTRNGSTPVLNAQNGSTAVNSNINNNNNNSTSVAPHHIRNVFVPNTISSSRIAQTPSSLPSTNVTINQQSAGSAVAVASSSTNTNNISCANIVSILSHHRHSTQDIPAGYALQHGVTAQSRCLSVPKSASTESASSSAKLPPVQTPSSTAVRTTMPVNVTAVDVNFYRAVPVTVVSSVPTIHCINNIATGERGNNVSNVNIVQAMPPTMASLIPIHHHNQGSANDASAANNGNAVSEVTVSPQHHLQQPLQQLQPPQPAATVRTFISTEAQTDDTLVGSMRGGGVAATTALPAPSSSDRALSREQRRRERRERRHLRRLHGGSHQHSGGASGSGGGTLSSGRLPDLLSNHMPPPYSTNSSHLNGISGIAPSSGIISSPAPSSQQQQPPSSSLAVPSGGVVANHHVVPPPGGGVVPPGHHVVVPFPSSVVGPPPTAVVAPPPPGQLPMSVQGAPVAVSVPSPSAGCRFPFATTGFRRSRFSDEHPKSCCGLLAWKPGSLRWFIALIAVVAVCCVLVGTALGAMRPAGRDHLTVSLLMIGVGIVLVTVSGVAWRLTSHDTSTCRAMLGLGSTESVDVCPRRFVPRLPPTYGRPHHPYAAMIYPEFQYRPPPPTYQASMQEYRLRLLLLDRGNASQIPGGTQNGPSPPPTYRSYAGSLLRGPLSNRRDATQSEYSFPPSYRSHSSSTRPGTMDLQTSAIIHSREHSLSLSESNHESTINSMGYISGNTNPNLTLDNITIDSLKLTPENDISSVNVMSKSGSCGDLENTNKDTNLVTIVQKNDQNPVIVTVSGCSQNDPRNSVQITEIPSEMEILAHL